MKKFLLSICDSAGNTDGSRSRVYVDVIKWQLVIRPNLKPYLNEIVSCELHPLSKSKGIIHLKVIGPTFNNGNETDIFLITTKYFCFFSMKPIHEFIEYLKPFIGKKMPIEAQRNIEIPSGSIQLNYVLSVSVAVAFLRKQWFSYDSKKSGTVKTYLYLILTSTCNCLGVLLFTAPYDLFVLTRNLLILGHPPIVANSTYAISLFVTFYIPYKLWLSSVIFSQ